MTSPRTPLLVNAAFSLASGALIGLVPGTVGGWLGVDIDGWLRLVGLALFGHGVMLLGAVRQPDVAKWAKLNLMAIAPYPLLMIVLVATGLIDRPLGQVLALVDGAAIAVIAGWLGKSLREPAPVRQPQHA